MTVPFDDPKEFASQIWRFLGLVSENSQEDDSAQTQQIVEARQKVINWVDAFLKFDDYKVCEWNQYSTKGTAICARNEVSGE